MPKAKLLFPAGFLMLTVLFSGQKIREEDLAVKYREWLKLTRYIILPQERDVFLSLTNDRDRDIFLEAFWKQRDPTPGTPQNEYKEEHIKRFRYANEYFRRGTTREGWMTDMGRMYIILGPPASTERFEGVGGIYPCQVWYYYGDKSKGLPTYFSLLFFQRHGSGEFELYNSLADGPASLIVDKKNLDLNNPQQLYDKIREMAPTLAGPAISMIPGQYAAGYRPSLQDNLILSQIIESPKKDVSPTYATHFLNYSGIVSTEYLTNYIECSADASVILDPLLNVYFVHFSISPSRVSIDYFEPRDQYYCNFQLNVSVRQEDRVVFQYSKDFPFYFPPQNVKRVQGSGIAIQDSFPLVEGEFTMNVLVQNSVGKEFSVFERSISVPTPDDTPKIVGPVMGYGLQSVAAHLLSPFQMMDKRILVDPQNTLAAKEELAFMFNITPVSKSLWEAGRVDATVESLGSHPRQKTFVLELKNYSFHENMGLTHVLPAGELAPDYYVAKLTLKDGKGTRLDEKTANFIVSPQEVVPHPTTLSKAFPLDNHYLYFYSLAFQAQTMNRAQEAEDFYLKAYVLKPDYKPGLVEYIRFLLQGEKYRESLSLVDNLRNEENLRFQFYLLRGKALMGLEEYGEAIRSLEEGNKLYDSDTDLLNALGWCYHMTGDKSRSLAVLKASLRLNPDQAEVQKLVDEIEKQ